MKKEPWQIAAARYCVENSEKGFKSTELKQYIQDRGYKVSDTHVEFFFQEEVQAPPGRRHGRGYDKDRGYVPPLDMVSTITDLMN